MQVRFFISLLWLAGILMSCTRSLIPEKPALSRNISNLDTLPLSELDIPVKIYLRPLFQIAEKKVDVVYTSPGWPYDYVVENCDTRYMYKFRRGPLQMSADGNQLRLGFTGYYQVVGSQRVCTGLGSDRTALSPWSPPCTCGLKEGERKVNVSFGITLGLTSDYHLQSRIIRMEPVPIDKCTMCLWEQDLTPTVMQRLRDQLDDAVRAMQDSIRTYNLRPQFQQIWTQLITPKTVAELGYLSIQPEQIRLSNFTVYKDTAYLSIGLSARPRISLVQPESLNTVVPELRDFRQRNGFNIFLEAQLDYDSLSERLTKETKNLRIDLEKTGKYVLIERCEIYGVDNEKLILKVNFSGSHNGIFYLTGKPVYDLSKKILIVEGLDFDIRTRDLLIRSAQWLFSRKITTVIQNYTRFDAAQYESWIMDKINRQLNQEFARGIFLTGRIDQIGISGIYPLKEKLIVRLHGSGNLNMDVRKFEF